MMPHSGIGSSATEKERLARLLTVTDRKLESKMRAIEHMIDHSGQPAEVKKSLRKRVSDRFKNI
jgi:hypothetical protein